MTRTTARTERIRRFLLESVREHRTDLAAFAGKKFGITRQAINCHIKALVDRGDLAASGDRRNRTYELATRSNHNLSVEIQGLEEDSLWRTSVEPLLTECSDEARRIWHYGFTEMVNNAIDHSAGTEVQIVVEISAIDTTMQIRDDGIGIFTKIRQALGLDDERHAVLELAKGKLTTDPDNHSGEGIFFTSRMFNRYEIVSSGVIFGHHIESGFDFIFENVPPHSGTAVKMQLRNATQRTTKEIFDEYSSQDGDYGFSKTVVAVRLLQRGSGQLVSRSQAKRLMANLDRFQYVMLDFNGVDHIGQAFADEIFRVFARRHPGVNVVPINTSDDVQDMVNRALTSN